MSEHKVMIDVLGMLMGGATFGLAVCLLYIDRFRAKQIDQLCDWGTEIEKRVSDLERSSPPPAAGVEVGHE